MKHEDEKTALIKKLLIKKKSLPYIEERFSEEFETEIQLIHIYNAIRSIAEEFYLEKSDSDLNGHKLFPELRFILAHEPTSMINEEKKSKHWRILLNNREKFLIFYDNYYVGETDFGGKILDYDLKDDFLLILTTSSVFSVYLPSFKTQSTVPVGTEKPLSLDSEHIYFREFRQKYIVDKYGNIHFGIAEKGKFDSYEKSYNYPDFEEELNTELNENPGVSTEDIDLIEILLITIDGRLLKVTKNLNSGEINIEELRKFLDFNIHKRVRFLMDGSQLKETLLSSQLDYLIDSTQRRNKNISERITPYVLHNNIEAIVSRDNQYVFVNDYNTTKVIDLNQKYHSLIHDKFLSVHQIDSEYFILTSSLFNQKIHVYKWNGNLNSDPSCIEEISLQGLKNVNIISADLHVKLKEKPIQSEKKFFIEKKKNDKKSLIEIIQKYSEVEFIRVIRDIIFVVSRDRLIKAWTLDGEYLGIIAELKDFSELRDFAVTNRNTSGYVIDDTLVLIGNRWISGSQNYGNHLNICLGGIPEIHFKNQFLKVYFCPLKDAFIKMTGEKSNATKR